MKNTLLFILFCLPFFGFTQSIPDFTFQTIDGNDYSRSDIPSNQAVLIFYFDPSCESCEKQVQIILQESALNSIPLVMVSNQGPESSGKFYNKYFSKNPNARLLTDTRIQFDSWFGYSEVPSIFCYNAAHVLTEKFTEPVQADVLIKALQQN